VAAYITRRVLWMVVLLLLTSFVTFAIFYLLPAGDPATLRAGRGASSPELLRAIRHQLALDQPFYVEYGRYMQRLVLHFDLGTSYQNLTSVRSELTDRLPATAGLVLGAVVVWVIIGISIGLISGIRRGSALDRAAMSGALIAISAPVYWLGLVSLYLLSKGVGSVEIFDGAGTYPTNGDNLFTHPVEVAPTLFLPWLVLAAGFAAIYARFVRSSVSDVIREDYIRTARAKGLRERRVIFKHVLRPAITPIVTLLALDVGILLGGAILVETVFNIPGVGKLAVDSIHQSDLPTIQGVVLAGAFFIILLNLLADIAYAFLDPRVRFV
jgi:peptide/nickel transport system permease protein